jgi:Family of unknown function (DUF6489)
MKVNIEIDCTPQEARAFLGLPDVAPMQEALMAEMQERIAANFRAMEPQEMMRFWLGNGAEQVSQFYEAFARMAGTRRE